MDPPPPPPLPPFATPAPQINKADGASKTAAARAAASFRSTLHFHRQRRRHWAPTVLTASAHTGAGVPRLCEQIEVGLGGVAGTPLGHECAWEMRTGGVGARTARPHRPRAAAPPAPPGRSTALHWA